MKHLVVIDNFYENPEAVRKYALHNVDYVDTAKLGANFPGTESKQSFYNDSIIQKMERAIGMKIKAEPKKYSFGVFAKTFAQDDRRKVVHVDGSDWTGLVYLCYPEHGKSGTVFHRHLTTGLDSVPNEPVLKEMGYQSAEDFNDKFIKAQARDESKWGVSARVGLKFNRMVLFQAGRLFHSAEGYFGTEDQNCRLIQLFFFKTEGAL